MFELNTCFNILTAVKSVPLIGFLIFFAPFIFFIIYYIYKNYFDKNDFYGEPIDSDIILLAGIIIKSDEKISDIELKHIKRNLDKNLSPKKSEKYYQYLKKSIDLELDLDKIISETKQSITTRIDYSTTGLSYTTKTNSESNKIKIKWMHFLISVAVSDRFLSNKELIILEKIREGWELPKGTFNSLLAIFNYTSEEDLNQKTYAKTYTENSIKKYFTILELEETANETEIKAAYRRLVKIYHPDKQKKESLFAEQKFHAIQNAYEKVKIHRNIL